MYFLALVMTLRTRKPGTFSCAREEVEKPVSLFLTSNQTAVFQPGRDMRVALLWHDHSQVRLRLACLNMARGALQEAVQQVVAPVSGLHYAGQQCEVESVDLSNTRWAGTASWTDMVDGRPAPRMKLTLTTPLFTSPSAGRSETALPFPDPLTLFTAAQQQWQNLNGPALPYTGEQAVDLAKCMVAEYHLQTVKRVFADGPSIGYLGWIEYICLRHNEAAIRSLNALTRLSFFTGCGYLVEQGMGVTTVNMTK